MQSVIYLEQLGQDFWKETLLLNSFNEFFKLSAFKFDYIREEGDTFADDISKALPQMKGVFDLWGDHFLLFYSEIFLIQ